jgi:hypothetical protein
MSDCKIEHREIVDLMRHREIIAYIKELVSYIEDSTREIEYKLKDIRENTDCMRGWIAEVKKDD